MTTSKPKSISARDLIDLIEAGQTPVIYDVRKQPAFDEADSMIVGAKKADHETLAETITEPVGTPIVVYCVHGHEVSQGAWADLSARGHTARFLEGGIEGYIAAGGATAAKETV